MQLSVSSCSVNLVNKDQISACHEILNSPASGDIHSLIAGVHSHTSIQKRHCSFSTSAKFQVGLVTFSRMEVCLCLPFCLFDSLCPDWWMGLFGHLCARVLKLISQNSTNTTCFVGLHQLVSTVFLANEAEETTAAEAAVVASSSQLHSPLNHTNHCLQLQHPHHLLIRELTLWEWTWPGRTAVCKQHHLTRQSLCKVKITDSLKLFLVAISDVGGVPHV